MGRLFPRSSDNSALRSPFRRFATQVFFSVFATFIPNLLQPYSLLHLNAPSALLCVSLSFLALDCCTGSAILRSFPYCIACSLLLAYLHQLITATMIGRDLTKESTDFGRPQHVAVYFCLAFITISEFENWHAYSSYIASASSLKKTVMRLIDAIGILNTFEHLLLYSRDAYSSGLSIASWSSLL